MQRNVSLENLGELDNGAAKTVINAALMRAIADLDDRGDDGKPREVTIKVSMKKIDGGLVSTHVEAATKCPSYVTNGTVCRPKVVGGQARLLFQQLAPDDPDQRTIDEALGDGGQGS